jgi:hypothetical protein
MYNPQQRGGMWATWALSQREKKAHFFFHGDEPDSDYGSNRHGDISVGLTQKAFETLKISEVECDGYSERYDLFSDKFILI